MNNQVENNNQYVIFKLHKEDYGIPIHYVEIIEKVTEITRVPNAPYYIQGVINLRGEVVPVLDLRKRFQFPPMSLTEESRVIILSVDEMIVGILVDSSSEVLTIEAETIDHASSLITTFEDDYINGIGKVNDRMIIMVDVPKILGISLGGN